MACEYMVLWSKCLKGFLSFLRTRSSTKYHGAGIMHAASWIGHGGVILEISHEPHVNMGRVAVTNSVSISCGDGAKGPVLRSLSRHLVPYGHKCLTP